MQLLRHCFSDYLNVIFQCQRDHLLSKHILSEYIPGIKKTLEASYFGIVNWQTLLIYQGLGPARVIRNHSRQSYLSETWSKYLNIYTDDKKKNNNNYYCNKVKGLFVGLRSECTKYLLKEIKSNISHSHISLHNI